MPVGDNGERNFWFGDVFFKSFAGVFDLANQQIGMVKSAYAPDTVLLNCVGGCEPTPEPEPTPDPSDDDDKSNKNKDDDNLVWLWIVIALALLLLLVLAAMIYYRRKAGKADELNAILYSQAKTDGADDLLA